MLVTIMTPSTALAASGDPGTEYVVRAYARVEGKTFYSGYAYFTTLSAPIVVTGAADPVTWYSAVIHGLIHQGAAPGKLGGDRYQYPVSHFYFRIALVGFQQPLIQGSCLFPAIMVFKGPGKMHSGYHGLRRLVVEGFPKSQPVIRLFGLAAGFEFAAIHL